MGGPEAQLLEGYCDLAEEGETFKRMRAEALCGKAAFRR